MGVKFVVAWAIALVRPASMKKSTFHTYFMLAQPAQYVVWLREHSHDYCLGAHSTNNKFYCKSGHDWKKSTLTELVNTKGYQGYHIRSNAGGLRFVNFTAKTKDDDKVLISLRCFKLTMKLVLNCDTVEIGPHDFNASTHIFEVLNFMLVYDANTLNAGLSLKFVIVSE